MMNGVQFITDDHGHRTAVILPMREWEQIEKAKDILEHVYLAGLIEERKASKAEITRDGLMKKIRRGMPMRKLLSAIYLFFIGMLLALPPAVQAEPDPVCEMSKGYENNMVVYGTVHLPGDLAGKRVMLLARGADGEGDCRAKSVIEPNGSFYATIAGSTNGETIRFVVLDTETGKIVPVTEEITFQADATMADIELW